MFQITWYCAVNSGVGTGYYLFLISQPSVPLPLLYTILLYLIIPPHLHHFSSPLNPSLSSKINHRCTKFILGVSWKDKVTNEEVRARTGQQSILNTLSGRRLRWLGHTIRMDHRGITHQALYWEVPGFKRGPGRSRTNWRGIVKKDLRGMGLIWEEAEVMAAVNRQEWRQNVAQYVQVDVG